MKIEFDYDDVLEGFDDEDGIDPRIKHWRDDYDSADEAIMDLYGIISDLEETLKDRDSMIEYLRSEISKSGEVENADN